MSIFFDILSSINNPDQQGNVTQLESITNAIQQAGADQGIEASRLQDVMSALGSTMLPIMQKQQGMAGIGQLDNLISPLAGSGTASNLQSIFPPQLQQQIAQTVSQKTGISTNILQGMLPSLIPSILGIIGMGSAKPGTGGTNPLLTAFLDKGADNDMGTVFKYANRFLNPPQR